MSPRSSCSELHPFTPLPPTEVLPRFILLRPYLDDDTKILMFGAPPLHPSIPSPLHPFTPLPPTEVLPRFILLRPYLDDDTKILMFGASYQAGWLELLAIPQSVTPMLTHTPNPSLSIPQRCCPASSY